MQYLLCEINNNFIIGIIVISFNFIKCSILNLRYLIKIKITTY